MSFLNKIFHRNRDNPEGLQEDKFDFGEEHRDDEQEEEFNASDLSIHQPIGSHIPQQNFSNQGNELLMSRLETINAKLDSIIHRLEKLERIAERESGSDKW